MNSKELYTFFHNNHCNKLLLKRNMREKWPAHANLFV